MADQQQVSTSHQLALLHPLHPNMPPRIVSGSCHHATLADTLWTLLTCEGAASVTDHLLSPTLQQMQLAVQAASCWCLVGVQSLWQSKSQSSPCPPSKHTYKLLSTTCNTASLESTEKHVEHRLSVDAKLSPYN